MPYALINMIKYLMNKWVRVLLSAALVTMSFFLCIKKDAPELRAEVTDIKMDCSANPTLIRYEFSQIYSHNSREIISKKGRVQCGYKFFDFYAVFSDGNKLTFIDVIYEQKKIRLMEDLLSPKSTKLINFEASDKFLSWTEFMLFTSNYKCFFYYDSGRLYCESI